MGRNFRESMAFLGVIAMTGGVIVTTARTDGDGLAFVLSICAIPTIIITPIALISAAADRRHWRRKTAAMLQARAEDPAKATMPAELYSELTGITHDDPIPAAYLPNPGPRVPFPDALVVACATVGITAQAAAVASTAAGWQGSTTLAHVLAAAAVPLAAAALAD